MDWNQQIQLWNEAKIKILDARWREIEPRERMSPYYLPANVFIFIVRGKGQIEIGENTYELERFQVFSSMKGIPIRIVAESQVQYYIIFYSAKLEAKSIQTEESQRLQMEIAFLPHHPLIVHDKLTLLHEEWQLANPIHRLHANVIFQAFVYELLVQLQSDSGELIKPDIVSQAIKYLEHNYDRSITLEQLADQLQCSSGYLSRAFKAQTDTSPIHYLRFIRASKVQQLLMQTDATLQEIAEQVGYLDAHSLSRSFKKYKGLSPLHFKNELHVTGQDMPILKTTSALQSTSLSTYTDIDNQYHSSVRGDQHMYGKVKITVLLMIMSLSLLLGACSTGAQNTKNSDRPSANSNTVANPAQGSNKSTGETRIVSTLKGNVEVPAHPQRVAADQYMGQLLKLGIVPVGVRNFMLTEAWIEQAGLTEVVKGIQDLSGFPMDLEMLTELEPDLIIGSIDKNIESYEKIATTVFIPYWEGESTAGPLEKFRRISEVFGKEKEADEWIQDYEKRAAEARAKIKGIIKDGETVSIIQVANKVLYVQAAEGGNYGSPTIYKMLGLSPTEQAKQIEDGFASISLEALPQYVGDHIFIYGAKDQDASEVLDSKVWKNLEPVKNGKVYQYGSMGDKGDEFVMEDPYSLDLQLETIVDLLLDTKKFKQ
jgi:iron complex transport system substrate-binding protein